MMNDEKKDSFLIIHHLVYPLKTTREADMLSSPYPSMIKSARHVERSFIFFGFHTEFMAVLFYPANRKQGFSNG